MTEYRNPQDDPGSQKRLMLAFFLVFVMIAAMQFFLKPPAPKPGEQQQNAKQQPAQSTPTAPPSPTTTPARSTARRAAPASVPKAQVKQASAETQTVLENDLYRITFTNHGGMVKSWILKKYKNDKGQPLDLVNETTAPTLGFPLSLFAYDKDLEKKLNDALYQTSEGPQKDTVTFEYSDGDLLARKVFHAEGNSYLISMETEVTRDGQPVTAYPQWPGGVGDQANLGAYASTTLDWNQNGSIERKAATSGNFITGHKWVANGQTLNESFHWVGLVDKYFAVVFMPPSPEGQALVTLNNQLEVPKNPGNPSDTSKEKVSVLGAAFGSTTGLTRSRIFAGPKAVDLLEATQAQPGGPDLRGVVDFGTFGFIAKPLFLWLKWTYEHWIPNWGWAIAFLTVVITMALLPLRMSSQKSALKMQKIQPQVKAITEKYKRYSITDPRRQEMQKEMSELYKKEGVNPVGGCFPMLLQMPFLFAFYSMLGNAIELRLAPWLWIKDLSAPDPTHILPIAIVISMFIMQKSTPQAGMDPAQQKMLNFMGPLMIGGISWGVASGLCVYWAISNVLGYVQQVFLNRSELAQQVRKSQERRATRKR
ncbi:MAG TPA: membrane protein insertase YidC [Candidatus Angelobacter sp.]|nr:membrane protein insertase YidC [Candidatus Angelobacter sp.]